MTFISQLRTSLIATLLANSDGKHQEEQIGGYPTKYIYIVITFKVSCKTLIGTTIIYKLLLY